MGVVPILSDDAAGASVLAVFDDIRAKRQTDYVNNFWRALAADPALLTATWDRLQAVMAPGTLDPLTKELIRISPLRRANLPKRRREDRCPPISSAQ